MKRILVACIISITVGATLVAAAGSQASSDAQDAFVLPMPGEGSTATYEVREVSLGAPTAIAGFTMHLIWEEPTMVMDASYHWRTVLPLRIEYDFGRLGTSDRVVLYDAGSLEPMVERRNAAWDGGTRCSGVCFNGMGLTSTRIDQEITIDDYSARHIGPCGAIGPWLTEPLAKGDRLEATGNCRRLSESPTVAFQVARGTTWEGLDALEVHGARDHERMVWAEGIPFPAIFTAAFSDIIHENVQSGRTWEAHLIHHEATAPFPRVQPQVAVGPGPIEGSAHDRLGLDETGIDHPFPMSAAVEALRQDPLDRGAWLDDPAMHIPEAWGYPYADENGQITWNWQLVLSDGRQTDAWLVSQDAAQRALSDATGTVVATIDPLAVPDRTYPSLAQAPSRVPTVTELMERYDAFNPQGNEANRWGYMMSCETDCKDLDAIFRGGYFMSTDGAPGPTRAGPAVADHLHMEADGTPRHMYRLETHAQSVGLTPAAAPPEEGSRTLPIASLATWHAPEPSLAAGIGSVALLSGALYYLWPQAKAFGLGMFTRIRRERVLDHPLRARIHDVIQEHPGIHFQGLAREVGTGRGALDHHLRQLVGHGVVSEQASGGFTCYFLKGTVDHRVMAAAGAIKSQTARQILSITIRQPGLSSRALAAAAGVSASTASYHISRLDGAGLLERDGRGGSVRASELGQKALRLGRQG